MRYYPKKNYKWLTDSVMHCFVLNKVSAFKKFLLVFLGKILLLGKHLKVWPIDSEELENTIFLGISHILFIVFKNIVTCIHVVFNI